LPDLIRELISPEVYLPRGHCYLWKPRLVGVELAANLFIAVVCLVAATTLAVVLVRQRQARAPDSAPAPRTPYAALAIFLLASGLTHLFDVWVIWRPLYCIDVLFRVVAGLAAIASAVAVIRAGRGPR